MVVREYHPGKLDPIVAAAEGKYKSILLQAARFDAKVCLSEVGNSKGIWERRRASVYVELR